MLVLEVAAGVFLALLAWRIRLLLLVFVMTAAGLTCLGATFWAVFLAEGQWTGYAKLGWWVIFCVGMWLIGPFASCIGAWCYGGSPLSELYNESKWGD